MTAALCPTCGQPRALNAARLLDVLTNGQPHREVYRGQYDGWWVTYGGGETTAGAVRSLVDSGKIHSIYSDCLNDAYHIGRTLDCKRTLDERKKHRHGKDAPLIYVDDPT